MVRYGESAWVTAIVQFGATQFQLASVRKTGRFLRAMSDDPKTRPVVTLLPGHQKRAQQGHPWVYSNEIAMSAAAKALPPGSLVTLQAASGETLGVAMFNPRPLVSARFLDRDAEPCHRRGIFRRTPHRRAAAARAALRRPFYRLIHAEADGLPGVVVDRFGDVLVAEINTAGIDRLESEFLAACHEVLHPRAIVLRNDSASRALEGLPQEQRVVGELAGAIAVEENGARFRRRSGRRAEDRLVLRSARQSPRRRRAGGAACACSIFIASPAVSASRRRAPAPARCCASIAPSRRWRWRGRRRN